MPDFNTWFPTSKYGSGTLNVKDFGAVGDQATDDGPALQAAFDALKKVTEGGSGAKALYIPPGIYNTSQVLYLIHTEGVRIFGDGPNSTIIQYVGTANAGNSVGDTGFPETVTPVIMIDGFAYSEMSGFSLQNGTANGYCMYIYQSSGQPRGITTGNMYSNINCGGRSSETGEPTGSTAFLIGWDALCSEQLFLNCAVEAFVDYGWSVIAFNALNINLIGCGGTNCGVWARVSVGAINIIGASLAANGTDITVAGGMPTYISGVRTESAQFVNCGLEGLGKVHIQSCSQVQGSDGFFCNVFSGVAIIEGCYSEAGENRGRIVGDNSVVYLKGNLFSYQFGGGIWDFLADYTGFVAELSMFNPGPPVFADLPPPTLVCIKGLHTHIIDAPTAITDESTFGDVVTVGGGAHTIPVWCDGTNWRRG